MNIEIQQEPLNPTREYKDRLFRMIFKEKESFLELYNAMNGTAYDRTEDLTVTTLENAVYIGMRNDVSYLLYDQLSLYEHQSTFNPNMPLRDLFYVTSIYSNLTKDANLYSSRLIQLPTPQFIVFYNGSDAMEEQTTLRLSDSFSHLKGTPKLELEVLVLNINPGFNEGLMEKSRTLHDYMVYVSKVRRYSKTLPFPEAVDLAMQECISENVLADFLSKNRAEVKKVSIFEYDEEKHIRQERAEALEEGIQRGLENGHLKTTLHLILSNKQKGLSLETISDFLGEDLSFVQAVSDLIDEHPSADTDTLFSLWNQQ